MLRVLAAIAVLLGVLAGAVLSRPSDPPADFRFINRGDVSTLDPQKMSWLQDIRIARMLYEGLVRNDVFAPDFKVVPAAAESWSVSGDGRVYTFHLRGDAKWSNGEPVRSGDFKYAWRRALLTEVGCDYIGQFKLIRGAAEFVAWREAACGALAADVAAGRARVSEEPGARLWRETLDTFDSLVGLRTPDDRTLVVELVRPVPYFLDFVALAPCCPVYPALLDRYERPDGATGRLRTTSGWTRPPEIVGNGPYELTRWRFKREMRFEANEHFWNKAVPKLRTVVIPSVGDGNAQVLSFDTGGVDFVTDVIPGYRAEMLAAKRAYYAEHRAEHDGLVAQGLDPISVDRAMPPDPRQNIHVLPTFGTYFYNFNCSERLADGRPNPFHDARVRRAFAMAIDKRTLVEDVRRCGEPVATTLIPEGSIPGYRSPAGVPFDPALARELLAEAGYPGGAGLLTVEILYNKDGEHDVAAQAIMKDWEQHLGVDVELAAKEIKVFRRDLKEHNYMVARGSWYGDYLDPMTFLEINRTGDENNDRAYSNAAYDELLSSAELEADTGKRVALLEEAERMLIEEELPLIPLYRHVQIYLFNPHKLSGVTPHPRQDQQVWLFEMEQ
ncbi:MAG: peptide ABC transporter substrate-binding protein [Phycisphaerales bacterium]|nr:peptide ABC transporter substrate-binding protein [Phycisphaerales bacterium]